MSAGLPPPRVLAIPALDVVSEEETLDRVRRLGELPTARRDQVAVIARDPQLSTRALLAWARALRAATSAAGVRLLVADRLDVARLVAADGAHLGRTSVRVDDARALLGLGALVTVSAHDLASVRAGAAAGADAVLLSPIFPSPGKGRALGVEALREARATLDGAGPARPLLVALGGVDPANVVSALAAGADGAAAIRADPALVAQRACIS